MKISEMEKCGRYPNLIEIIFHIKDWEPFEIGNEIDKENVSKLIQRISEFISHSEKSIREYEYASLEWTDMWEMSCRWWAKNIRSLRELNNYCKEEGIWRKRMISNPHIEEYLEVKFQEGLEKGKTDEEAEEYAWDVLENYHGRVLCA